MADLKVGARVSVDKRPGMAPGTIRYVGMLKSPGQPGKWVGVELDDAEGNNDGSTGGVSYFKCASNHGMFVRPAQVAPLKEKKVAAGGSAEPVKAPLRSTVGASSHVTPRPLSGAASKLASTLAPKKPLTGTATAAAHAPVAHHAPAHPEVHHPAPEPHHETPSPATEETHAPPEHHEEVPEETAAAVEEPTEDLHSTQHEQQQSTPEVVEHEQQEQPTQPPAAPSQTQTMAEEETSESVDEEPKSTRTDTETPRSLFSPAKTMATDAAARRELLEQRRAQMAAQLQMRQMQASRKPTASESIETVTQRVQMEALQKAQTEVYDKMIKEKEEEHKKAVEDMRKRMEKENVAAKQRLEESIQSLKERLSGAIAQRESAERDLQKVKHSTEEKVSELSDELEMVRLDKELAEERISALESELQEARDRVQELDLELQIRMEERAMETAIQSSGDNDLQTLASQNEKLKEALVKIRDLSMKEKQDFQKRIKQLEIDNNRIPGLLQQVQDMDQLKIELASAKDTIADLKEQLDVSRAAEAMVEELTEKNLELEESLAESQAAVADLEALQEMSAEMEESMHEEMKALRIALDLHEGKVQEQERQLALQNKVLEERQTSIQRFRHRVQELQDELGELHQLHADAESQNKQVQSKTSEVMQLYLQLQARVLKDRATALDQDLQKAEAQILAIQVSQIQDLLPESVVQVDVGTIRALSSLEQVSAKCAAVIRHIQSSLSTTTTATTANNDTSAKEAEAVATAAAEGENSAEVQQGDVAEVMAPPGSEGPVFAYQMQSALHALVFQVQSFVNGLSDLPSAQFLQLSRCQGILGELGKHMEALIGAAKTNTISDGYASEFFKASFGKIGAVMAGFPQAAQAPLAWRSSGSLIQSLLSQTQSLAALLSQLEASAKTIFGANVFSMSSDVPVSESLAGSLRHLLSMKELTGILAQQCRKLAKSTTTSAAIVSDSAIEAMHGLFLTELTLVKKFRRCLHSLHDLSSDLSLGLRESMNLEAEQEFVQLFEISEPPVDCTLSDLTSVLDLLPLASHVFTTVLRQQKPSFEDVLISFNEQASAFEAVVDDVVSAVDQEANQSVSLKPLQERAAEVRSELSSVPQLRSTIAQLEQDITRMTQSLVQREQELSSLRVNFDVLEKRYEAAKAEDLQKSDAVVSKLNQEIEKLKKDAADFTRAYEELNEENDHIRKENARLKKSQSVGGGSMGTPSASGSNLDLAALAEKLSVKPVVDIEASADVQSLKASLTFFKKLHKSHVLDQAKHDIASLQVFANPPEFHSIVPTSKLASTLKERSSNIHSKVKALSIPLAVL